MCFRIVLSLLSIVFLNSACFAQNERGSTETTVDSKTIRVDYGRPVLQGRDVLSMANVGTVWRLGADQATEIETTGDLLVAGEQLKAGRYSLWAKKTGSEDWILAFHPSTGIWGDPSPQDGYVAELPLSIGKSSESVEMLTIQLSEQTGQVKIMLLWGYATLTATFSVQ